MKIGYKIEHDIDDGDIIFKVSNYYFANKILIQSYSHGFVVGLLKGYAVIGMWKIKKLK